MSIKSRIFRDEEGNLITIVPKRHHYVAITVHEKGYGSLVIDFLRWKDLTFDIRIKWEWYFRYRAALLKVKYPRSMVLYQWGNYEVESEEDAARRALKNRITAKKGKVTEVSNKLKQFETEWSKKYLFPASDQPEHKFLTEKLTRVKKDLIQLENQLIS
jgi:hypothetical protein